VAHKQQAPVGNCNPDRWKYVEDFKCKHPRLRTRCFISNSEVDERTGTPPQSTHQLRNGYFVKSTAWLDRLIIIILNMCCSLGERRYAKFTSLRILSTMTMFFKLYMYPTISG
jgi:hypothetical protein